MDVNQNIAECIKSASHFTYTEYVNICSGEVRIVEYGFFDFILVSILVLFLLILLLGFILIIAVICGAEF